MAVAQLVEPRIVIPVVVGSSPISHPISPQGCKTKHADVVELVDTPDLGSGAARCESSSLSVRTIMVAVAQLVEPRIVIPVVVGSSPISHPISCFFPLLNS